MTKRTLLGFVSTLVTVLAASGPLEAENHSDAFGMEILDDSDTGLVAVSSGRNVTGSLATTAGGATEFEVFFLGGGGDRFHFGSLRADHEVTWAVVNASIAEIEPFQNHFRLVGKMPGSTSVMFSILHGAHSDYASPLIPIEVRGAGTGGGADSAE